MQVNDKKENNLKNFEAHLDVTFKIQESNDSTQSKNSN